MLLVSILCFVGVARAQIELVENPTQSEKTKPQTVAEKEKAIRDQDSGIFSFMNFSFMKKKPTVAVDDANKLPEETEFERITRLANSGDVNAQLSLGYKYLYGEEDIKTDYKKAFEYYSMAAEQNDDVAINNVGSLYFSGIGTERNTNKAATMFQKASDLGNSEATLNLAFLYLTGNGVVKNSREAISMFTKAAKANNSTAKFMLGYAYYKGFVVPQDFIRAAELIKDASDAQYADAQYVLGIMYMNGQGMPQNYGNAVKLLKKSGMQGNLEAMMELGNILASGSKYPKDNYTAHVLFNLSSVRGAPDAAEKRNFIEQYLQIDEILQAQSEAEGFREKPSEITVYINQTFGKNIKSYIDEDLFKVKSK